MWQQALLIRHGHGAGFWLYELSDGRPSLCRRLFGLRSRYLSVGARLVCNISTYFFPTVFFLAESMIVRAHHTTCSVSYNSVSYHVISYVRTLVSGIGIKRSKLWEQTLRCEWPLSTRRKKNSEGLPRARRDCHALQRARIALEPRSICPGGLSVSIT